MELTNEQDNYLFQVRMLWIGIMCLIIFASFPLGWLPDGGWIWFACYIPSFFASQVVPILLEHQMKHPEPITELKELRKAVRKYVRKVRDLLLFGWATMMFMLFIVVPFPVGFLISFVLFLFVIWIRRRVGLNEYHWLRQLSWMIRIKLEKEKERMR